VCGEAVPGPARPDVDRPAATGFDAALTGRHAECDGGGAIAGTRLAGREDFAGTLTGDYIDHGDPPWRWYLLRGLTQKPPSYALDEVWCESGSLYVSEAN
jgi:hypothetical protein